LGVKVASGKGKMRDIEEIRAELRAAEQELEAEKRAAREAVKPAYRFTLLPVTDRENKVYDDTCRVYRLEGVVLNEDALKAVGAYHPGNGAMRYLFNTGTGKLVTALGGGTIYVSRRWGNADDGSDVIAMAELSAFLVEHPEGGDVTEIVEAHRQRRGV
jgi:hypothetical protein